MNRLLLRQAADKEGIEQIRKLIPRIGERRERFHQLPEGIRIGILTAFLRRTHPLIGVIHEICRESDEIAVPNPGAFFFPAF